MADVANFLLFAPPPWVHMHLLRSRFGRQFPQVEEWLDVLHSMELVSMRAYGGHYMVRFVDIGKDGCRREVNCAAVVFALYRVRTALARSDLAKLVGTQIVRLSPILYQLKGAELIESVLVSGEIKWKLASGISFIEKPI